MCPVVRMAFLGFQEFQAKLYGLKNALVSGILGELSQGFINGL